MVDGHPYYMVSDRGRVKSLPRVLSYGGPRPGKRFYPGCMLKTYISTTGYLATGFGNKLQMNVHRVVAIAFLGPPPFPGAQANHKDGNRANPRLSNLEWTTPSENAYHSYASNGRISSQLGRFGKKHNAHIPVISINLKTGRKTRWGSAMDAVRAGFRSDGISRACAGKIAHHKGYLWRYADGFSGRIQDRNSLRFAASI